MSIALPRSFGSFGKPKTSLAIRIARPVLGSLAGAAASWVLYYSLVRNGPSKLSDLGSQLRGWVPRARRTLPNIAKQIVSPTVPAQGQKASPPKTNPDPVSTSQPSGQPHKGPDWTHAVLEAMKKEPRDFGYAKVEWNAPLLSQYLEKHHGQSIPANRIRETLKESGYEWHITRYRKAHH